MGKDWVILELDKIYTSYFARATNIIPDSKFVSIALYTPDNWKGQFIRELNPSQSLLFRYKHKLITWADYVEEYTHTILDRLDYNKIYTSLCGRVACCWEKSWDNCHRHLVLEWLSNNLGEKIIGGEI